MERVARPHWLQVAGHTRTPKTIVTFDTETQMQLRDGSEILTLRCWDARIRVRAGQLPGADVTVDHKGEAPAGLVDVLEAAVTVGGEAWAFAHNLGFDLTVTSLPLILTERGWRSEFVNIGDESCVFVFRGDAGRLVVTDSWSWLRCSLAQAAGDVGMRKTRLPADGDGLKEWHARCAHDVQILDRLLADLLDWWDGTQLGGFAVTSAACGWRSLRARIQPRTVLVGPDGNRTRLEREAIFGGRKEVWRVGEITGRWVDDFDLVAAHLTTMANLPMPCRPLRGDRVNPALDPLQPPEEFGTVCRVEIITRTPCAPLRVGDDVWWPVGRFRTVLTSAELAHVLQVADKVECLAAAWYWLTDDLTAWGQWCEQLLAQPDPGTPKVVRRVAKGWGRSVPGRFALSTSQLIAERPATKHGWALETGHDLDTGDPIEIVTYGGVERTYRKDQDGTDVSPVVLAFVEGYVRAGIGETIASRPPENMLQVNTDGWWEMRGRSCGKVYGASAPPPWTVARKATTRKVTLYGPNHVQAPGDRRLAGVPKDAEQQLDGTFAWHDWPGLRWQLQHSRPGEYVRPGREMLLADHYCRRWVLDTGETVPVTVTSDRRGRPALLPWSLTAGRRCDDRLADHQVPALAQLADRGPARPPRRLAPPDSPLGRS